ncbi:hypothetical protein L249_0160 [Ophiocordyceps polyrhachis-furcata BCC 54312]|uniref:MPN domain-containing protein n=1 Tax=Ophiocordyceps polyrhachis-furcata BCC 54312 TaxID=1330021 RepID=A0A367LE00_9HYPO|nr:hypothetical protein L249_0160 [Ophiocordyceps polyrhachis-furcata BCC 54312]
MEARSSPRLTRPPPTVSSLVAQAESFNFNTNISFKHWARAAETLFHEASFAISDGDYGRAYMMLYRHSVLVLKCLPSHPQFKEAESRRAFRPLSRRIDIALDNLERIKPVLEDDCLEWEQMASEPQLSPLRYPDSYADFAMRDPTLSGPARVLDASEHQDLAVDLAQKELARRDRVKRVSRLPPSSELDENNLQRQMETARRALSLDDQDQGDELNSRDASASTQPYYPSIARSKPVEYEGPVLRRRPSYIPVPCRPPKETIADVGARPADDGLLPAVPRKLPLEDAESQVTSRPPRPPKGTPDYGPSLPRKDRLAFKPGAYLENGDPIRSVFVPSNLRSRFLEIASKNTEAGLEMCGILCGLPINNALFVRCLLIPDQRCTSDTCETENEGAMFDYCASEDLLVLGWIHTHPTQTCFMSSRDLHTQAGYQVMMAESIAIVCAPRFQPDYGIFRLTHPPGLDYILDCRHQDTFHQHTIDNIYRETEHPDGHVYESDKLPFYVHDLRTK